MKKKAMKFRGIIFQNRFQRMKLKTFGLIEIDKNTDELGKLVEALKRTQEIGKK